MATNNPAEITTPDEAFVVTDDFVTSVEDALDQGDIERAAAMVGDLHAADQADVLQFLKNDDRGVLIDALGDRFEPVGLTYLDILVREDVIAHLGRQRASAMLAELDVDDTIEVLSEFDEPDQLALLAGLPRAERIAVEAGLAYPEHSAGRLMSRDLVVVPDFWIVGQTIDFLRAGTELPDEFYDIYIVDPRFRPIGTVPLSRVLRSKRSVSMHDLKGDDLRVVPVDMDQEEVGFLFSQYGLTSAPVVNDTGRLLGVITIDDVVNVIQEEAEEDILKLGGVQETDIHASFRRTSLRRFPWLVVNLGTAVVASMVIALFEATIAQVVALAVLMPIVASMGGNAGTQTLTVVVRGLAMHEVTPSNAMRLLGKEIAVGGLNGFLFMMLGVGVATAWFGDLGLGAVFGLAMIITLLSAALAGVCIPLIMDRFGIDPAVASGVFLTTITDVIGFFSFLGLAAWYLF